MDHDCVMLYSSLFFSHSATLVEPIMTLVQLIWLRHIGNERGGKIESSMYPSSTRAPCSSIHAIAKGSKVCGGFIGLAWEPEPGDKGFEELVAAWRSEAQKDKLTCFLRAVSRCWAFMKGLVLSKGVVWRPCDLIIQADTPSQNGGGLGSKAVVSFSSSICSQTSFRRNADIWKWCASFSSSSSFSS